MISTMERKQKWQTYRLAKRNVYFPDTSINFVRGKYLGKKGIIEKVTEKKYLKIRLLLDEKETERYPLVMIPPSSVEYEYNPILSKIMKKKCIEHKHAMEELRGIMKHSDDMSSSSE